MIIINFKNYKKGKANLELAKLIEKYLPNAIVCVPTTSIGEISKETKLQVYAQHVAFCDSTRCTGFILPSAVKEAGGDGTLLNHAEHKISFDEIEKTMGECEKVGLKVIVCSDNMEEIKKLKKLKPSAIAFEIPELIGTGKSITQLNPDAVKEFVEIMKGSGILALAGAGVDNSEDVRAGYDLGCDGVLMASAICKGENPELLLKELGKIGK